MIATPETTPVELKPCPFCASTSIDPRGWLSVGDLAGPACDDCGASAETVERWNNRPTERALVEALRSAIAAIEDDTGLDDAICCGGHDCGCRAATHRQLLLHDLSAALKAHGETVA